MEWYEIVAFIIIIIINAYLKPLMSGNYRSTNREYILDRKVQEKRDQILKWFDKQKPKKSI